MTGLDPFAGWLKQAVRDVTDAAAAEAEQWTIRDLRRALSACNPEAAVRLGTGAVTELCSYRGYYDRLALIFWEAAYEATGIDEPGRGFDGSACGLGWYQPGSGVVRVKQPCTVADLLEALELADGATFEGYKGGQYRMDSGTYLHSAAHRSDCGDMVVGLTDNGDHVVILTEEETW